MKNKFQSLTEKGRWLLATLTLLFTLGIGQMWAAETILATFRITLSAAPTDKYASYSDDDATYTCNKVGSNSSSNYALVGSQYYMKLTAKDAYVKIKLKSGSIAAGDKVYVYHNHTTNKNGVGFAMTQEGTNGATGNATANTELKLSYTLTASDIAADGSISVYRQGSNLYVGRIEVAHPEPECTKPGTPADLADDSKTYNSATFSWSVAANSNGYKVYVEKKSDKSKILDWTTCATTSYTATGLAAETEYTFKVKAIGASGYCEFGDEATVDVTTEAAPSACPEGLGISGTKDYTEGETISLTAALEAGNGGITYTWYKGSIAAGNEVGTGASFSKANCVAGDAGDYFCVASKDACANAESAAYAVTVAAAAVITCPEDGTLYKFVVKTGLTNGNISETGLFDITTSNYLSQITAGGALQGYNNNSKFQITDAKSFKLTDKTNSYLKVDLGNCTFEEGDVLKYIITSQNVELYLSTSKNSSEKVTLTKSSNSTTYVQYALTGDDSPVGKSVIYIYGASNSPQIYSFEVIRPKTITLDATTNGGDAVAAVKGLEGEKVVLPHAFKSGYKFKGWFESATGGEAVANYYTVPANPGTLYAQFEALPESGEMFKMKMESSMKPGTQVGLSSGKTLNMLTYATVTGGAAILENTTSNNDKGRITTSAECNFNDDGALLTLTLDFPLAVGDEIVHECNSSYQLCYTTTKTRSTTHQSTSKKYIVTDAADGLKGKSVIYVWRAASSETKVTKITINRPAKHALAWNFGEGGSTTSTTHTAAGQVIEGATITYPADNTMSRDGYTFAGWSTDATVMPNTDLTITAQWTAWPTVTLNRGAAPSGDDENAGQFAPGAPVEVPACPFSYTDYNFNGWEYSPAVTMVDETHFTMPSENLTLTAQWVDANNVAQIGSTKYATLEAALADAANGTIELLQDIDVTAQVEIAAGVTATIDLAGHKIEYTGDATLPSGVILVHNGASLTINDSSDPDAGSIVSGDKAYAAVALTKAGDDAANPATLTVNGGTLSGYYYGITGNGSRNNTVITINGGTITGTVGIAIYHPQVGTLTVNNGSLTGEDAAIEMRAGTLVINDGTFTATATEFSCNPNGSGSTTSGAAIAIAQHTTKKDIEVTINGGTFNGVKALNESNPQVNDPAPQVAMAITDGEFNGAVETVDVNNYISGGTFSNALADAQCATDYYPATKPNGKYGVTVAALSVNFVDEANAETPTAWATFLNNNHYDYNLGDGGEISWDKANAYDTGLKLKKSTNNAIYFTTEPGKLIELTVGNIAGMTIQINGGAAQTITGGTNNDNLGVSYYYSDNAQAVVLKETSENSGYNMLKSINIRDPYTVSFDANGGDAVASLKATPAINLPSATNGTQNFAGWYDALDNLIGNAGDPYTPTANIELVAHWEALSTVNTLSDLQVDGVTVDGFASDVHTYYIVVPYGTAVADLPKITSATPTNANANVAIWPAAGPQWTDDFGGCYRQQANVTPQDPNAAVGYNDIRITIAPKDMLCIIKAEHNGTATGATITGYYGGEKDKNTQNGGKLGSNDHYFGIKLAEEAGTFQAGDVLKIYASTPSSSVEIFTGKTFSSAADSVAYLNKGTFSNGIYTYTLENATEWLYLYRTKTADKQMNPTLGYMAVYRPVPNPLVETITFNGAVATVDNTASPKTITVEVPASTDMATIPVVATFYSNDPSQTSGAVTGGTWAEGDNEYIVTDKDNDQTVYTVTITKAAPSSDATLSALSYGTPATAIALEDGVYVYNVTLPYGTTTVPALAAMVNHAGATIESIDDATAFVDRKATSTVTVKAEDDATTQTYTVNFTVDRYETTVLWDASVNDNLSQLTGCTTAGISVSDADDVEFEGKTYGKKALSFGGKTKSDRYLGIQIPNGKVAKVSIVYKSRGTSARSIMLATTLASAIDEQTIVSATAETQDLARMTADIFAGGTIYINTTDGFYVYEIDVQLADGYGRSAMLGAGVYGTVCVPNNVAVEDIQGVTVYELMGREPQYGKLAFDEIVSGELEAGVPYLFQAHGNHMALLYGTTHKDEPVYKDNGMYGTFEQIVLTDLTDVYYFAQRALWSCDGAVDLTVGANRAYVKLSEIDYLTDPNPAPGRRRVTMTVNGEKVTTDIENLFNGEQPVKVMIDGQIFIIRGEKMFDVTGKLVK